VLLIDCLYLTRQKNGAHFSFWEWFPFNKFFSQCQTIWTGVNYGHPIFQQKGSDGLQFAFGQFFKRIDSIIDSAMMSNIVVIRRIAAW